MPTQSVAEHRPGDKRLASFRLAYRITPGTTDQEVRALMREQPTTYRPRHPEVTVPAVARAVHDHPNWGITQLAKALGMDPRTVKNAAAIARFERRVRYARFWKHWRPVTTWVAHLKDFAGPVTLRGLAPVTPSGTRTPDPYSLLSSEEQEKNESYASGVVTPSRGRVHHLCAVCGDPFIGYANAVMCSTACRMVHSRTVNAVTADAPVVEVRSTVPAHEAQSLRGQPSPTIGVEMSGPPITSHAERAARAQAAAKAVNAEWNARLGPEMRKAGEVPCAVCDFFHDDGVVECIQLDRPQVVFIDAPVVNVNQGVLDFEPVIVCAVIVDEAQDESGEVTRFYRDDPAALAAVSNFTLPRVHLEVVR
jgi:uncharacterized Zn finger protein (UPF0148 family)